MFSSKIYIYIFYIILVYLYLYLFNYNFRFFFYIFYQEWKKKYFGKLTSSVATSISWTWNIEQSVIKYFSSGGKLMIICNVSLLFIFIVYDKSIVHGKTCSRFLEILILLSLCFGLINKVLDFNRLQQNGRLGKFNF